MTLIHRLPNNNRKIWRCDNCGKEDSWGDDWVWYGSWLDEDTIGLEDIPTLCSDECKNQFSKLMQEGKVTVLRAKAKGYSAKIVGKRKGF